MSRLILNLIMIPAALCLIASVALAERFSYRYFDHNGFVHLGYSIPPEFVVNGYEVLNERGRVVDVILPKNVRDAQTAKFLAEAEKKRNQEVQDAKDEALLRYYSTPEDVIRVRDRKLEEFDNFIAIQTANIDASTNKMVRLQRQAADIERSGRTVTNDILETLATLQAKINESEEIIKAKKLEKEAVNQAFQEDIDRLKFLLGNR